MDPIADWLIDTSMSASGLPELLDGLCRRLVAEGLPVVRGNISLSIIDPAFRAKTCTWRPETGAEDGVIPHERENSDFQKSPIGAMFSAGQTMRHWLIDAASRREFPVLDDVAMLGATDYLAIMHPFASVDFGGLRGVALTLATSLPAGLDAAQLARLRRISDILAPIVYRLTLGDIAIALMDAYVGPPASRRILNGEVRRGAGEPIEAALMMADLSGFTAMADASGLDLIERLDEHLEAMAAPVIARGGSVLKFMGDGMLAAFPVTADLPQRDACRLALAAAHEIIARNHAVNSRRADERPLGLDVALHYGEVFYGNVGAPGRLDFTVIGPAVNEVSRMEALCRTLGRHLVMSAEVAAALETPPASLGLHRLRGVDTERELFGVE
jgi:adenylate cyclase